MKVTTLREKNTALASSLGLMEARTKARSPTTTLKDTVVTDGPTTAYSKETGRITKCMETVYSPGQMAELTKGRTSKIKKKGMVLLLGLMAASMSAHGLTASRMAWEPIPLQLASQNRVSGRKESV